MALRNQLVETNNKSIQELTKYKSILNNKEIKIASDLKKLFLTIIDEQIEFAKKLPHVIYSYRNFSNTIIQVNLTYQGLTSELIKFIQFFTENKSKLLNTDNFKKYSEMILDLKNRANELGSLITEQNKAYNASLSCAKTLIPLAQQLEKTETLLNELMDKVIKKIEDDLTYLTKEETIIDKRIKENGQQLSLLIAEELKRVPDKSFAFPLPNFEGSDKYFGKKSKPLVITSESIKKEYQQQLDKKIANLKTDTSFNPELFTNNDLIPLCSTLINHHREYKKSVSEILDEMSKVNEQGLTSYKLAVKNMTESKPKHEDSIKSVDIALKTYEEVKAVREKAIAILKAKQQNGQFRPEALSATPSIITNPQHQTTSKLQ